MIKSYFQELGYQLKLELSLIKIKVQYGIKVNSFYLVKC
jgi:hypothetical protein